MLATIDFGPRPRSIPLPVRGGTAAALEFGPQDRPIDIVFAHANGFNAYTYRTLLAPLEDLRILALDLRGHGLSGLPTPMEGRSSWRDLVEDHLALLDLLEVEDVVLAGHSMGGTVSLLAAAERPGQVRRLVLLDPVIQSAAQQAADSRGAGQARRMSVAAARRRSVYPSRDAAIEAYRGRGAFSTWPEATLADYAAGGFRDRPDGQVELACAPAWEASNYAAQDNRALEAFAAVRCRADILRAQFATTCCLDDRLDELTASGRVDLRTVPGTTHFLPIERPEAVRAALAGAAGR